MEKEIGSKIQLLIYRTPKTNHDGMVNLAKEFHEFLEKISDPPGVEIFTFDDYGKPMEGITSIANTVSAKEDEEVWVEILSYRDRKHLDEYNEKCKNHETMGQLWKKFVDLGVQGANLVMGDCTRLTI